jgi:hypothetical protein
VLSRGTDEELTDHDDHPNEDEVRSQTAKPTLIATTPLTSQRQATSTAPRYGMSQDRLGLLGLGNGVRHAPSPWGGSKSPTADVTGWDVGSVDPARGTTARASVRGDEDDESGNNR